MKKLVCAIMTKFDEKGNLVLDDEYKEFLRKLIDGGVDTLMVAGTNGEFHAMDVGERKALLEFVWENFKDEADVIAHIGTTNLRDTLELGKHAADLGVKKLAVVSPYYYKYDFKSLVDYFIRVARSFEDSQVILYNIPVFSGNRIGFSEILRIKEEAENVIGMKDSDARPTIVSKVKEALGEDFLIFGGNDTMVVDYLAMGSDGQVSGTSNVFPKILREILDSFEGGKFNRAFELQKTLNEIVEKISGHEVFVNANRYALEVLGYDLGYSRSPFRELDDSEKEDLKKFLGSVKEWSI